MFKNNLNDLIQTLDGRIASQTAVSQPMQQVSPQTSSSPLPRKKRDLDQYREFFNKPTLRTPHYINNQAYSAPISRYDYYTDTSNPGRRPGVGNEHGNIWNGFYQGPNKANCTTVSSIKAAMMRFGQKPSDIFTQVKVSGDGYDVTMRDGFRLYLSKNELADAIYRSDFRGSDNAMLADAYFLYAVSAKRAQIENNKGYAGRGFDSALYSINNMGYTYDGLRRLGLSDHIRHTTAENLAYGQLGIVDHYVTNFVGAVFSHSLAVVNGQEEVWGNQGWYPPADSYALALV